MIHITGFEEFAGEQQPGPALQRADYIVAGNLSMVSGRAASGISSRGGALSRRAPWASAKFSTGFAHQFDARGSVAWLKIGARTVVLWMNPDTGMPTLNDRAGGALPTANRWYYYELEIERATGNVALFINNKFDSIYNLGAEIVEQQIEVGLGYMQPQSYRADLPAGVTDNAAKTYDDFYMRDDARLGPIAVTTRFPYGDANVEWFKSDASKSHSEILSLHPPKPLDNYVASADVGDEDRFTSSIPLANNNAVVATGVVVLARKSPTLAAKLGVFIGGDGDAELRQDTRLVDSDWRTQYVCFEARESDTVAGITATEFGFNVAAP